MLHNGNYHSQLEFGLHVEFRWILCAHAHTMIYEGGVTLSCAIRNTSIFSTLCAMTQGLTYQDMMSWTKLVYT
jgi:hypothetical protein